MKGIKIAVASLALFAFAGANAATLRVNNAASAGAEFTTVSDALEAAEDGDVIIIEPSVNSYGDFEIRKKVTLKGAGYFREINHPDGAGGSNSEVGKVTVKAEGVTLTGLKADYVNIYASNTVVTRCYVHYRMELGDMYGNYGEIANCVLHQNYLNNGVSGSMYSKTTRAIQITNNIFSSKSIGISNIYDAVVRYNTFLWNDSYASAFGVKSSIVEHNIGGNQSKGDASNSYADNVEHTMANPYNSSNLNDLEVKKVDEALTSEQGAFAGETPYVLSGVPTGPVVLDVEMPNALVKGEDLNVTVTIGVQK
ncbi:MAG: hypothetical protein K2G75_06300 [Muribaculaceae bacterium]|nr:hypothetical protein [Muribaculaceae bacterium]MDE5924918.1 hypothetical protein [Muribaculaceae bacterium]